jgi:DNA invertase Pin-like site-specific DNA recombinase
MFTAYRRRKPGESEMKVRRVIGYVRVSTREQGDSGAGLAAQRTAIQSEAKRRGWTVKWITDVSTGTNLKRDGLQEALALLQGERADALVVAKLDRLSRSLQDFAQIMAMARREGWALVALDLGIDSSTPTGELVASVMMSVAQWEARIIGERTKAGLAEKRAAGVVLGRPKSVPTSTLERIGVLSVEGGLGPAGIARQLAAEGVPAPRGETWHRATVGRLLAS